MKYFLFSPGVSLGVLKVLVKELAKAVFIEDFKRLRLSYMWLGIRHWARGQFGKLPAA
jgi:hypothetical protein